MTKQSIIETHGLTKRFATGRTTVDAVSDLSITVQRGELVAFLGPNGAGKSTSLRLLTTLLKPSSGSARVAGHDIVGNPAAVRANIGYVGQLTSGGFAQRVRDELLSQGAFYGMERTATRARADELIRSLDLSSFTSRSVQELSGGQKRRLDIALGLMHAPPLLFLDEPSTGLDPQSRANLWQHILDIRERYGTTVFLTTHYLEEADRYAERVMVMDSGRVIADATAAQLKADLAGDVMTLGFETTDDARRAAQTVRRLSGRDCTVADLTVSVTVPGGDALLPTVLRELDAEGVRVCSATGVPPTLDDVFLALTGRTLRESSGGGHDEPSETRESTDTQAGIDTQAKTEMEAQR